jgi:type III restriction enzyme
MALSTNQNPILNNPYLKPLLHYGSDTEGNLDYTKIIQGRRDFSELIPILPSKAKQEKDHINRINNNEENHIINLIRKEIDHWRSQGYPNTTRVTSELLNHWFVDLDRKMTDKRLFFAQQEALETAIWLNEVAEKSNYGNHILNLLNDAQQSVSSHKEDYLPRIAFKMATGTGKTVVMGGLILYHYFNRKEYRNDKRFADNFLIVAPGITIKDRLGVLRVDKKNEKDYYYTRGLVPEKYKESLEGLNSRIVITNYHSFEPKNLQGNKKSPFDGKIGKDGKKQESKEDFTQVIKRLLKNFKTNSRIIVLNDEAHHCYLPLEKPPKNTEDNAETENQRAAIWFTGLKEIAQRFKISHVYDLSATPYYLSGSGHSAYSLFPWVVSDFGLIEAIESGLVKIPFLPEFDNTQEIDMPKLRNLYEHVKDELPKKKSKTSDTQESPPKLPQIVTLALEKFVNHYIEYDQGNRHINEKKIDLFDVPPVLIIVCNNTSVSKEIYKYIAGFEYNINNEKIIHRGKFGMFSNYDDNNRLKTKPPTLLIDSDALENSNQIDDSFKKVFAEEINNFKQNYRTIYPEKSVDNISDSDILREVVNTVGKKESLGSHIRCVVSVSMLTEGWDANTVTHIMGLRAFGSQLLCEQVAGRALRRKSYILQPYTKSGEPINKKDINRYQEENILWKFPPEYAHIIGVPFKLFKGGETEIPTAAEYTHIYALPEREGYEIKFPNIIGYRVEVEEGEIKADFSSLPNFELDFTKIPIETKLGSAFTPMEEKLRIKSHKYEIRDAQVIYFLTKELIKYHYSDLDNNPQFHKFNKLKKIVEYWFENKITLIGETDKDCKRLLIEYWDTKTVVDHINLGILSQQKNQEYVLPIFNHYNKFGSTKHVNGNTSKEIYPTTKSHVNFVVADTESWEQICAKTLDEMDCIISYVKNAFLGFQIPYVGEGKDKLYYPDFIAKCKSNNGQTINLIIEITGMNQAKANKRWYVENRWLPAVNNVRSKYSMDPWYFIEISNDIRFIKNQLLEKIGNINYEQNQLVQA